MRLGILTGLLTVLILSSALTAQAEWQAIENIEAYSITGRTGAELYQSIGKKGPVLAGKIRAIAHTRFRLTWSRKYEPQGETCVLVSARPKLVITYTLPKPANGLPAGTARNWETFIAGVKAHEKVHGDMIKEMVRAIESASVGLTVADDPDCRKIRVELTNRLSELSRAQRQTSRNFDQAEFREGGNLHQLVLNLVNGH